MGTDFDDEDTQMEGGTIIAPVRDHGMVYRFGKLRVVCPTAPMDPQPARMGRCETCGVSLAGRLIGTARGKR